MPRYAAIDIGSNSVRMQTAEVVPGAEPRILAADREVTRLGASVFRSGFISEDAIDFVCGVLARFAETYRGFDVVGVRVVATSAVRDASNQEEFIQRASETVGTPVEVISGLEEARLIHLGLQSRWPQPNKRVLIVDVGGGSAELIVSDNGNLDEAMSRPLGAVRLTEMFVKSDPPQLSELHRLEQFIDEKLERAVEKITQKQIDRTIATSATAAAIVCGVNGIARAKREEADRLRATRGQVRQFFREISASDASRRKKMAGVGPRRSDIIVAGTAVFLRVARESRTEFNALLRRWSTRRNRGRPCITRCRPRAQPLVTGPAARSGEHGSQVCAPRASRTQSGRTGSHALRCTPTHASSPAAACQTARSRGILA